MNTFYFLSIFFNSGVLAWMIVVALRSLHKHLQPVQEYEVLGISILYNEKTNRILRILFPGERFTETDDLGVMVLFESKEEIRQFPQKQLSVYILDWLLCYEDVPIQVIKREIPFGLRYQVFPYRSSYSHFPDLEVCRQEILVSGTEREQILLELVVAWQNFVESKTGVKYMLA